MRAKVLGRVFIVAVVVAGFSLGAAPAALAATAYFTDGADLHRFDTSTPADVTTVGPITGLAPVDLVRAIDFRPLTGELYGITTGDRLYKIDTSTGAATQVGTDGSFDVDGDPLGFDFNPAADRMRTTSLQDDNKRLNPFTGTLVNDDSNLFYAAADPNSAQNPTVGAIAYDRNFAGTSSSNTTAYAMDHILGVLATLGGVNGTPSPNNGQLFTVGPLGIAPQTSANGFDIAPDGTAYLAAVAGGLTSLYTVNLTTGAATLVGTIGTGVLPPTGLAIRTPGAVDHDSLAFEVTEVGKSSDTRTLEFTNRGPDTEFDVSLTGPNPGDFEIVEDGCGTGELPSGEDCEITLRFKPTSASPADRFATLAIVRQETGNVFIGLTGTAKTPAVDPPAADPPTADPALCRGDVATVTGSGSIAGTPGSDVIVGSEGADTITGGGGDDTICALGGDDTVTGGIGEDVVRAGAGNDGVRGGGDSDRLAGRAGNDSLRGGSGKDRCDGGAGTDTGRSCEKEFSVP